jgi:hypothetical protein
VLGTGKLDYVTMAAMAAEPVREKVAA